MAELTALTILIFSLLGMGVIIFRKVPILAELPEILPAKINWKNIFLKLEKKIKIFNPFRYFSGEIFLQKILSKIRILTLKIENKIFSWLKQLRVKAKMKKNLDASYWEKIKKSIKK